MQQSIRTCVRSSIHVWNIAASSRKRVDSRYIVKDDAIILLRLVGTREISVSIIAPDIK